MFHIKNISSQNLHLEIVHPEKGLLRVVLKPNETSDPIQDTWLEHFQKNSVAGIQIMPDYPVAKNPEPLVINSTGPIEVKKGPAKQNPSKVK